MPSELLWPQRVCTAESRVWAEDKNFVFLSSVLWVLPSSPPVLPRLPLRLLWNLRRVNNKWSQLLSSCEWLGFNFEHVKQNMTSSKVRRGNRMETWQDVRAGLKSSALWWSGSWCAGRGWGCTQIWVIWVNPPALPNETVFCSPALFVKDFFPSGRDQLRVMQSWGENNAARFEAQLELQNVCVHNFRPLWRTGTLLRKKIPSFKNARREVVVAYICCWSTPAFCIRRTFTRTKREDVQEKIDTYEKNNYCVLKLAEEQVLDKCVWQTDPVWSL